MLFFFSGSPFNPSERFFGVPHNGKQFQMCFSATNEFPNMPKLNFINALNHDMDSSLRWELSYGEKCQGGAQVSMKGKLKQSDEYRHQLRISDVGQRCKQQMDQGRYQLPECQNATRQAGYLDQYKFEVDFKDVGSWAKNWTFKAVDWVQQMTYPWFEPNYLYKGKNNKVEFEFEMSPYGDYFNASAWAPEYAFEIENYPVDSFWARYFSAAHTDLAWYERLGTYAYQGNYKCKLF